MDFNGQTAFMAYGKEWRKHRVLYHPRLNGTAAHQFRPTQAEAIHKVLGDLVRSPEHFGTHIRQ